MKRLLIIIACLISLGAQAQDVTLSTRKAASGTIFTVTPANVRDTLLKVRINGIASGHVLRYDGTRWVNVSSSVLAPDTTVYRTVANSYSLSGMQTKLNGYVKLNPSSTQTGNIDVSGAISTGSGLTVAGNIINPAPSYASGGYSVLVKNTGNNAFQTVPSSALTPDTTVYRTVANSRSLAQWQTVLSGYQTTIIGTANQITKTGSTLSIPSTFIAPGSIAATSLTASGLTSGRIPIVSTSGLLIDNGQLRWNNTNNWLGIGGAPLGPITSIGSSLNANIYERGHANFYYPGTSAVGGFTAMKARGAVGTPTTVLNLDGLGGIFFGGHDGTNWLATSFISGIVNGTVATGSIPTDVIIATGSANNAATEKFRVGSSGAITVATAPTTSAGTYDILTRNTSTGVVEKTTTLNLTSGAVATTTPGLILKGSGNNDGGLQLSSSNSYRIEGGSGYNGVIISAGGTAALNILSAPGNAMSFNGTSTATSFIKSGGTSSQFLMADGSAVTAIPSATTATTQTAGDNSTKVATTAYVDTRALSGTYTPTLTNSINVSSSAANPFTYMRVGNIVSVWGSVSVTPTSNATLTELGITIPIASNFTSALELNGNGTVNGASTATVTTGPTLQSDATNDRAKLTVTPPLTSSLLLFITFSYQVL